jgi:hypothetical protein
MRDGQGTVRRSTGWIDESDVIAALDAWQFKTAEDNGGIDNFAGNEDGTLFEKTRSCACPGREYGTRDLAISEMK